jgi:hypothetical protein
MAKTARLIAAATFGCVLLSASANAGANRAFISALGTDTNPCTITLPCRSLQAAFNVTASGGEIEVLDPAAYGALNITHSIMIEGHGWATVDAGTAAINITVGPNDNVSLRGLVLQGIATKSHGLQIMSGGSVELLDSEIRGFPGDAVSASDNGATLNITIRNSIISKNMSGLLIISAAGGATHVTVSNSVIANNSSHGINSSASNGIATVMVRDSLVVDNGGSGLFSGPGNESHVARSTFKGNDIGLDPEGGSIISYGDNNVFDNRVDGHPTSTITGM